MTSRKHSTWTLVAGLGAVSLLLTTWGPARSSAATMTSSAACAALKGRKISLVVPYSPGGGYDLEARTIAPYLRKALDATVVVTNRPGAGGLLALNDLVHTKPDGTTIAVMNGVGAAGSAVAGARGVRFKMSDFSYLAGLSAEPILVVSGAKSKFKTFDDVRAADKFRFGSTGPGASNYVTPTVLASALKLHSTIITGFRGAGGIQVALEQGNIDGTTGNPAVYEPLVKGGDLRPLLLVGDHRLSSYPETPTVTELKLDASQKLTIDAYLQLLALGRPFVGPPKMAPDLVKCMRAAFDSAVTDPTYVAAVEKQKRPLTYANGAKMDQIVQAVMKTPPSLVELLKSSSK